MPIYDYECPNCGYQELSVMVDKENNIVTCRKCKHKMNKLFPTNIGLQFKGSGWSKDNYCKNKES